MSRGAEFDACPDGKTCVATTTGCPPGQCFYKRNAPAVMVIGPSEQDDLKRHAADVILREARRRFSKCAGSGDPSLPFHCLTCADRARCVAEHAEMVTLAVKLRGEFHAPGAGR